eukprot:3404389-Amphidinium_carterae.1
MKKHPAFSPRGATWVEDMIAAFDRNGDGFIDHEDIAHVHEGRCGMRGDKQEVVWSANLHGLTLLVLVQTSV